MKTHHIKIAKAFILLFIISLPVKASDFSNAKNAAADFFNKRSKVKSINPLEQNNSESTLQLRYFTKGEIVNPVYVFEKKNQGFVVIKENNADFKIVGYSETVYENGNLPPALSVLLAFYEQTTFKIANENPQKITPVEPLLNKAGISLNQYYHENAGGCPTGCVATAMAQIMAYHKFPDKGTGSHCYNHSNYGELCAEFEKTTYNWINPTDEDYKLLSFHVGVAMNMNYCGYKYGSIPAAANYSSKLSDYFKYHLISCDKIEYVLNEIEKSRPVYCEFAGKPGHSVVLDGYDENGLIHVNFGWGGKWNGYYMLNTKDFIIVDYLFGSNILNSVFISPNVFKTLPSDSLALVDIHNKLNQTTRWNLSKPVYSWPGVLVINERIVELEIANSQGTLSPEIGKLTALKKLIIKGMFTGTFPANITNLTNLEYLHIETNGTISGTLPDDIHKMSALKYLSLKNIITGTIPASIGQLGNLTDLNLSGGKISGSIPNQICNLTNLNFLDLSRNQLTGNIPANIGNLKNLNILHLSDNKLSGEIPVSTGNLDVLSNFSASNNQLSGSIPDVFSGCTKLETVNLNNNALTGEFPLSLLNSTSLNTLDVSNNQLNRITDALSAEASIVYLNLSGNKFTTLPVSMNKLNKLKSLAASYNKIDSLPENFGFLKSAENIGFIHNQLKKIPDGFCYSPRLKSLSLSNNKITGLPASINSLSSKLEELTLDSNEIRGKIPATLLLRPFKHFLIHKNRLRYEDIPDTTGIVQYVGNQKMIALSKQDYPVSLGDTVRIDIRKIAPVFHTGNKYYWCRYPKYTKGWDVYKAKDNEKESPILEIVVDKINVNYIYYCKIFNPASPNYTSTQWGITDKCLPYVDTDTISFRLGSEAEILQNKYPEMYVAKSENLPESTVQDGTVTLFAHEKVRGTLVWQASTDAKTWVDITSNMTNENLKANIQTIGEKEIILKPANTAWYRTKIIETSCEPVYGDTVKVNAPGTVLYDKTINVTKDSMIIDVDSIEIFVPKGFHAKDFRLMIVKLDKAPGEIPKGGKINAVYDIRVSFGKEFKIPLLIKLKNIPDAMFVDSVLPNVGALYFDDVNRKWIRYDNRNVVIKEKSLQFYTHHLTKITSGYLYRIGYTHFFQRKRVKVVYTSDSTDYMGYYATYWNNNKPFIGYLDDDVTRGGHPMMIQDIANIADTAIARFEKLGLNFPQNFTIYCSAAFAAAGYISLFGQFGGYITINPSANENVFRNGLKMTIPHELMHYLQDDYMVSSVNNTFWMEANAPLASRIVFSESELTQSEPDYLLSQNRRTAEFSSILDLLAQSWDKQAKGLLLEKALTSQADANLSSTFLYYMQRYRQGSKLDAAKLLTEYGWINATFNTTWRGYLDNQIKKQLSSTADNEYDAFVKYIISGVNKKFCISDTTGNPFGFYIENANFRTHSYWETIKESVTGDNHTGTFARHLLYNFGNKLNETITENIIIPHIPHLSSKMVLIENQSDYHGMVVEYKRIHATRDFFKVYYGWYDVKTKTMKMIDISDSAKYSFMVQKKSLKYPEEYKDYAFLLFVNKSCPETDFTVLENAHAAIFDITTRPVLDIESLEFLGFGDNTLLNNVHLYDDGRKNQVVYFWGTNKSDGQNITNYWTEKKLLNDSIIKIDADFRYFYENKLKIESVGTSIGYIMPSRVNVWISQTIYYNFVENKFRIIEIYSSQLTVLSHKDPFGEDVIPQYLMSERNNRMEIEFKCPENITMISESNDDYNFKTNSSVETQISVISVKHHSESNLHHYQNGSSTKSVNNYVSTDYSQAPVKLWGKFRADKPEQEKAK